MGEQAALIKFGQQAHILQLRNEGLLYMNNLPYFWGIEGDTAHFWRIEEDDVRTDPLDGVHAVAHGRKGEVLGPDGARAPVEITKWSVRVPPREPEKINIFCMYAWRPSKGACRVDERNMRFGDWALVVNNGQEFIDRIGSHVRSQAITCRADLVEYVDDEYTGEVGPFKKLRSFAYQSEWRVVCYDGPGGPREIRIGSIEDSSSVMPSTEVNGRLSDMLRGTA